MVKTARNLTVLGIGLSISAVVGWLLLKENKRAKDVAQVTIRSQNRTESDEMPRIVIPMEPQAGDEPTPDGETAASDIDDLTLIKDIGPRYAAALAAAGITRFDLLAKQNPEALADLLAPHISIRPQRIRTRNWIGQAAALAQRR